MGLLDNKIKKLMLGAEISINTGVIKGGIVATGQTIKPGDLVELDATYPTKVYKKLSANTANKVIGVCMKSLVNRPTQYPYDGTDEYKAGDAFDLFIAGEIALRVASDSVAHIKEGMPVYIDTQDESGNIVVRHDATQHTAVLWQGAKFLGITEDGLTAVRVIA